MTFSKARVKVNIDAGSIFTNEENRDTHLKSTDFFDVENHKEIIFESKSIRKVDDKRYKLTGDLLIKGISNEVVLDADFGELIQIHGQ